MQSKLRNIDESKPKNYWPVFIVTLPLCGVIASLFTILLAVQNAPVIENENIGRFAKEAPAQIAP